jgi:hypothetical protein
MCNCVCGSVTINFCHRIFKDGKVTPSDKSLDYGVSFCHMLGFDDTKMLELTRLGGMRRMIRLLWVTTLLEPEEVWSLNILFIVSAFWLTSSNSCGGSSPLIFFFCEKRMLGLGDCQFLNAKRCCLQLLREENYCLKVSFGFS